jgi:hypothetical protein
MWWRSAVMTVASTFVASTPPGGVETVSTLPSGFTKPKLTSYAFRLSGRRSKKAL